MTTITDTFTRADGALGANYTRARGAANSLAVASNACAVAADANDNVYLYTGASFGSDQEAHIVAGNISANHYAGVAGRGSGADGSFNAYTVFTNGSAGTGNTGIGQFTNGVFAELKGIAATFTSTDIPGIRVTGSNPVIVSMLKNGVVVDTYSDPSAGRIASGGTIGPYGYNDSGTFSMDGFTGGDVAAAAIWPGAFNGESCTVIGNPFVILQ